MSIKCTKCGYELSDGAKFCGNCGTTVEAVSEKKFCAKCGSQLKPEAKFCGVCGETVAAAPTAEEKPAEPEQPTMDELVPPIITNETFASASTTTRHEDDPDFESIEPPDTSSLPPVQNVQPTAPAEKPAAVQVETPTPAANAANAAQPQAPTQQAYSQPANNVPNAAYTPYPDPSKGAAQPGKNSSIIVPIILLILIIAVIAVDIFVLFPDRIFDKDDSSAEKDIANTVPSQTIVVDL